MMVFSSGDKRAQFRLETLDFAGARADSETALSLAPGESTVQSLYGVQIAAFGAGALLPQPQPFFFELAPLPFDDDDLPPQCSGKSSLRNTKLLPMRSSA